MFRHFSANLSTRALLHTPPKLRVRGISICFLNGFCALKATEHNGKEEKMLKQVMY